MIKRRGFRKLKRRYRRPTTRLLFRKRKYNLRLLKVRFANYFVTFVVGMIIFGVVLTPLLFIWYSRDLPSPDKVKRREGFSTLIMDRNEKPIYDIYADKNRIPVKLGEIPEHLKNATVAIEDKDFFSHQGFDPKGILRAFFHIITLRGVQGGSTLTQQLVKNVLLTSERTVPRKIKEFILAVQIERKYSKDEILQMYLNEAPYGGTMWGIESAAQGYFGKHAKDLTLLESVILAGFPQRPSYFSPFSSDPKAYISRSEEVLRRMREDKYITQAAEHELKRQLEKVEFSSPKASFSAPHFVLYVKKLLTEQFGEKLTESGGLKVKTTLDLGLQENVEEIVKEELEKVKGLNVTNGAVVIIDPQTGEILGYAGSKDYNETDNDFQGKFDVASMGLRQPGSALKPVSYATAFQKGYTPSSLLMDVETEFFGGVDQKDYVPQNYDNKFRGPVQLRFALANSINIPAVKITALVGVKEILKNAYDMGLSTLAPTDENVNRFGLSLTLGGGEVRLIELTNAYGVFATQGIKNESVAILEVKDSNGKTLFKHKQKRGKRVLDEDVCFLISHILSDNNARSEVFGPNSYLNIPGFTVAVKTGTTDDKRDNWTVGYTPSVVIGVWVGNNDNSPMNRSIASGVTGAAPIWHRIIKEALNKKEPEQFKKPDNVEALIIDAFGGGLPKDGRPERSEYFIKGTEPNSISPIYQKLKLSKSDNNKLANLIEIATGNFDEKDFIVFEETDPASSEDNRWQKGIDKWLETQSDPSYHPPKETSQKDEDSVVVNIKKPENDKRIDSNEVEVEAKAKAIEDIEKMELFVDNELKSSVDGDSLTETLSLDNGVYRIKIKAKNINNKWGESEIRIGVNMDPNEQPSSTPEPEPTDAPEEGE